MVSWGWVNDREKTESGAWRWPATALRRRWSRRRRNRSGGETGSLYRKEMACHCKRGPLVNAPPQPSSRFSLSPSLSYGFYGFTPPLSSLSLSPLRRPPPPPPATAAAFARAQSPEAAAARSELSRLGRPLCLARAPPILPREIIRWFSSNSHTVFVGGFRLGFAGSDYKCSCASCVKLEAPFRLKISAVLLLIVIKLVRFCCLRNAKITLRIAFPSGNNNLFLCKQEKCTITH